MILDPDNKYIQTINTHTPLTGKTVLEIGCGNGRITRDLATYAQQVVATDLDPAQLQQARQDNSGDNIDFLLTPDGFPDLPAASFDLVIYTLSLHHIPATQMIDNLTHMGKLLKEDGIIVVVEPGDGGSFLEVKNRFGAGSGDESIEKAAAIEAMRSIDGWETLLTLQFDVEFLFSDSKDFYTHKLPRHLNLPIKEQQELAVFLTKHTTERGIVLTSGRRLTLLTRSITGK